MTSNPTPIGMFLALTVWLHPGSAAGMGPDPGGHSGDEVTPQTTKTDRPEIDAKREQASGTRTETNAPAPKTQETQKD